MARNHKRERPPDFEFLVKPIIILVALSIVLALITQIISGSPIERLDVGDGMLVVDLFDGSMGGYVVQCMSEAQVHKSTAINSAFLDATSILDSDKIAKFATIDCETRTNPNGGRSLSELHGLDMKVRPAPIFVVTKGGVVKQVKGKDLKSGNVLSKVIRGLLEVRAGKVESTKQFKEVSRLEENATQRKHYNAFLLTANLPLAASLLAGPLRSVSLTQLA